MDFYTLNAFAFIFLVVGMYFYAVKIGSED
jgi:hypothetical protein